MKITPFRAKLLLRCQDRQKVLDVWKGIGCEFTPAYVRNELDYLTIAGFLKKIRVYKNGVFYVLVDQSGAEKAIEALRNDASD